MRVTQEIPLSQIFIDRLPLKPKALAYAVALAEGATFPPIHVMKLDGGCFKILDGRHRWLAHKLNGREKILAKWGTRITFEEGIYEDRI